MTFNSEEIIKIVQGDCRVPIEYRSPASAAVEFVEYVKQLNMPITNRYVVNLINSVEHISDYGQVASVKPIGEKPTYDIEVEEDHSYRANGIIVHNTCNMPNKATEKETSDLYFEAWHSGCKGMTQFRDGCRDGVLVTNKKADNDCSCTAVLRHSVPKREKSLPCDIHRFKNGGDKWVACVGLYNGEPYEIFTGLAYKLNIPEHVTSGEVIKNKVTREIISPDTGKLIKKRVSRYDIKYHDSVDGKDHILEDVGSLFCSEYYGYGKLVSGLLRHGMPLEYVVSTLENISDMGHMTINSWNRGVTRTLKKYLKDGETGEMCPECGGKLIRENGCVHCQDCGWSKCG